MLYPCFVAGASVYIMWKLKCHIDVLHFKAACCVWEALAKEAWKRWIQEEGSLVTDSFYFCRIWHHPCSCPLQSSACSRDCMWKLSESAICAYIVYQVHIQGMAECDRKGGQKKRTALWLVGKPELLHPASGSVVWLSKECGRRHHSHSLLALIHPIWRV